MEISEDSSSKVEVDDDASSGDQQDTKSTYPITLGHYRTSTQHDNETSNTSTRSLYEADLDYTVENERRYCSSYFMPNDEHEQTRLHIMHQVFLYFFSNRLTTISLTNPTKILDIGTGTGEWAIAMGEAHPSALIIGSDISAIQPTSIPHNVSFELFDAEAEDEWTSPRATCDLIHFRSMAGCFESWDAVYERALEHLKPGGWIEVLDCDPRASTFENSFASDAETLAWWEALGVAMECSGRDFSPLHLAGPKLERLGFVEVSVREYQIPLGVWPNGEEARSMARLWLVALLDGLEAMSLRLLVGAGWEAEDVRRLCQSVARELRKLAFDADLGGALNVAFKVLVGRKPWEGEEVGEVGTGKGVEEVQLLRVPYDDLTGTSESTNWTMTIDATGTR